MGPVRGAVIAALLLGGCTGTQAIAPTTSSAAALPLATATILPASEVEWQHLNPARGDAGPRAATLWGDRGGPGQTSFLVRFVDGFASPPHIHTVSYRGVVIQGLVHNDDPDADELWMPTGSFWTQPKGGVHITAAKGGDTIAYIEIDDGPFVVRPVDQATANDERPVNVDVSNIVWLDAADLGWSTAGIRVALLWGEPLGDAPGGILLRLDAGVTAAVNDAGSRLRAAVIDGQMSARATAKGAAKTLDPGSALSAGAGALPLSCAAERACLVYARGEGRLGVTPIGR